MSIFEGLRNESLMNKAYNLIQQGKYNDAIGYYDKILESDPHHVNALYGKGLIFQRWGMYRDALEFYDKVLKLDSGYFNAWYGRY